MKRMPNLSSSKLVSRELELNLKTDFMTRKSRPAIMNVRDLL